MQELSKILETSLGGYSLSRILSAPASPAC